MTRVLVVDDEPAMLFALKELLKSGGHDAITAGSAKEALLHLDGVDAVITDYQMPEMDGLQLLQAIRERDETIPVVMLTARGSERLAVRAIRSGAYEYLTKPLDIDEVSLVVARAVEAHSLRRENRRFAAERTLGKPVIGDSPAMKRVLDTVARIGPRDITVLVRGETGTGKELVAALLHAHSKRANGPLVRFNCAAIPAELAEAELFGHTRGAFTGAAQARRGYFAEANGGTLVLDEVGELPLALQAKLLRALQEGEIQPVGAGRVERVDVRVIASTNRDLETEVKAGRFREDLYYRLAVVELIVPPLREHRDDVPALAAAFARRYAERFGMEAPRLSPELLEHLRKSDWPGNVRQLENTIARMVAMSAGGDLGLHSPEGGPEPAPRVSPEDEGRPEGLSLREQVEALERSMISRTMAAVGNNQSEAARQLGLTRGALIDRLKKYRFIPVSSAAAV
jgi:DNA-binding NtrC family response regulator